MPLHWKNFPTIFWNASVYLTGFTHPPSTNLPDPMLAKTDVSKSKIMEKVNKRLRWGPDEHDKQTTTSEASKKHYHLVPLIYIDGSRGVDS